jgi:hypothetical protein
MIILGFLAVALVLAVAAVRFGFDSRMEAWNNELRRRWDPSA